jgi:hypothetical protein
MGSHSFTIIQIDSNVIFHFNTFLRSSYKIPLKHILKLFSEFCTVDEDDDIDMNERQKQMNLVEHKSRHFETSSK